MGEFMFISASVLFARIFFSSSSLSCIMGRSYIDLRKRRKTEVSSASLGINSTVQVA